MPNRAPLSLSFRQTSGGRQQRNAPEHVVDLQQQRRGLIELGGMDPAAEPQVDRHSFHQERRGDGPADDVRSASFH